MSEQPLLCAIGRQLGTDVPNWDTPCDAVAETSVWIRGDVFRVAFPDFPVYLCMDHRRQLDVLGVVTHPKGTA